jgi:hypothetical protein
MKPIKFHKDLYDLKSINSSVTEFSHLGKFEIRTEKNYISVRIEAEDKDDPDLASLVPLEFSNYVLNETIARRTDK